MKHPFPPRRARFVDEYLVDLNATQAAVPNNSQTNNYLVLLGDDAARQVLDQLAQRRAASDARLVAVASQAGRVAPNRCPDGL